MQAAIKSWIVFVGANEDEAAAYEQALREENAPLYDSMITHDFTYVFAPNVKSFTFLNSVWAPILRLLNPDGTILFAYPKSWLPDFQKYMQGRYADDNHALRVYGFADISRGVGFATRAPLLANGKVPAVGVQTIKHELAHLQNCGTWHDEKGENNYHPICGECVIIRKIAGYEKYPWCGGD